MTRADFAFPFAIAPGAGQAKQSTYERHIAEMVRQVLLTDPGERVCLPEFGAGLRRLLFSPLSAGLSATTQLLVVQSLNRWLDDQITVREVTVRTADDVAGGAGLPDGAIVIEVEYEIIDTRTTGRTQVQVQ